MGGRDTQRMRERHVSVGLQSDPMAYIRYHAEADVPALCDTLDGTRRQLDEAYAELAAAREENERLRDSLGLVLETVKQSQAEHDHSAFPLLERAAREALARPGEEDG